jgi:hypothetical protein
MKKRKDFYLVTGAFLLVAIGVFMIAGSCKGNKQDCSGLLCEYYGEIDKEFESTGLEKDQGYKFMETHAELDSTTNRIIIRSIEGIYFAYPSPEGWYAQAKGGTTKITLNELGHSLAEKELDYEQQISTMFNNRLNEKIKYYKTGYYNSESLQSLGVAVIDTSVFNLLKIDTANYLATELKALRRGEMEFYKFCDVFKGAEGDLCNGKLEFKGFPKLGFYNSKGEFLPVSPNTIYLTYQSVDDQTRKRIAYEDWDKYLLDNKLVVTKLVGPNAYNNKLRFKYECSPLIYLPKQHKWYGPDQLKEILKKEGIIR